MAVKQVEVTVSEKSYEFLAASGQLISEIKAAVDDGWQIGEDFTKILAAVVAFVPALKGIDEVKLEIGEDKEAFANALALGLTSIAGQFIK